MKKIVILIGLIFVLLLVVMIGRFFYLRVTNSPKIIPRIVTKETGKVGELESIEVFRKSILQKETEEREKITKEDEKIKDFWPYIPLFFNNGFSYLTVASVSPDPDFGTVFTPHGSEKIGSLAGYETTYCHPEKGCIVRVKTEKLNPDTYEGDRVKFFYSLMVLTNSGQREDVKKERYNGLECEYVENGNLEDLLLGVTVIYLPREKMITTVSFLGEISEDKKFRNWEEFLDFKVKFLKELTSYYTRQGEIK
jgi:hypothetical protein